MQSTTFKMLQESWVYTLYILLTCAVFSALTVIHIKYLLGLTLQPSVFVIPIVAGITGGYLLAYSRPPKPLLYIQNNSITYINWIALGCIISYALNIIHIEWILKIDMTANQFIAPTLGGIFFGYLLARIKILNNKLFELASTDILTQAFNRMHFDRTLIGEIDRVNRYGGCFSIIYFDVDHFKSINDQYGHQTGDRVLAMIARVVRESNRSSDVFARYGGDEFIIISAATHTDGAEVHANRIQKNIEYLNIKGIGKISCSYGIAEFSKEKDDAQSLINAADEALYQAKRQGRDCIIVNEREPKPKFLEETNANSAPENQAGLAKNITTQPFSRFFKPLLRVGSSLKRSIFSGK